MIFDFFKWCLSDYSKIGFLGHVSTTISLDKIILNISCLFIPPLFPFDLCLIYGDFIDDESVTSATSNNALEILRRPTKRQLLRFHRTRRRQDRGQVRLGFHQDRNHYLEFAQTSDNGETWVPSGFALSAEEADYWVVVNEEYIRTFRIEALKDWVKKPFPIQDNANEIGRQSQSGRPILQSLSHPICDARYNLLPKQSSMISRNTPESPENNS